VVKRSFGIVSLAVASLALRAPAQPAQAPSAGQAAAAVFIVARGDTLSEIAARTGTTLRALAERNHLAPPYALHVGQKLRLPTGTAAPSNRSGSASAEAARAGTARAGATPRNSRSQSPRGWGRPRHPGFVRLVRESDGEQIALTLRRVSGHAQRAMEHFLRFSDGRHHPIDLGLLRQLATVSDHFGGRRVHVISGFRPFRRGQWTPHSRHNDGHAIDFFIEGVPNRAVRDYCLTFPETACGRYPRSVFVHMDKRDEPARWVDWSRPGQRPIYGREDRPPESVAQASGPSHGADPQAQAADESVEDVAADNARALSERSAEPVGAEASSQTERSSASSDSSSPAASQAMPQAHGVAAPPTP
jgi:uncharacterized protein YcbK (DUF882 family)/LysM repeat protein